jgi:ribose transport system substrate-binding protein
MSKLLRAYSGLCVVVVVAMSVALSGCGGGDGGGGSSAPAGGDSGSASTADEKPRIALVMKSLANEFFKTMEDGAKAHQAENTDMYDLIVNGIKDERDLAQQVSIIEQMVSSGVDGLVVAPADSKALITACKRAMDAGVVVINIDNKLDAGVLADENITIPFVGPDNREGAKKVGDYLATKLSAGDEVVIIEGVTTAFNAQQRRMGFEDAMNEASMKIVGTQSAEWEMAKANTVAAAMLSEHPNLKAVLCANDSMALGAVAAVNAAGKADSVIVVGFDNISAVQEMIKDGRVLATADQYGGKLAVFGIETALEIIAGKAAADKQTPVDLITAAELN